MELKIICMFKISPSVGAAETSLSTCPLPAPRGCLSHLMEIRSPEDADSVIRIRAGISWGLRQ